eukprot:271486-Alexandrium_andersonii.AAC.1
MVPPPVREEEQPPAPALADAVPDTRLAAPAEPQAAAAAAAPAPQDVLQDLSMEFVEVISPASGDGAPAVQAAARGTTWLGPGPRAESALQR